MASTSPLRQLLSILTDSIDAIEAAAEKQPVKILYPILNDPVDPTSAAEQFASQPEIMRAANIGISAAAQIISTLNLPGTTLRERLFAVSFSLL